MRLIPVQTPRPWLERDEAWVSVGCCRDMCGGAEIAVHVEVWTDGKKSLGLTRELGVKPQQGRRGSLELCRLLCFGSTSRADLL